MNEFSSGFYQNTISLKMLNHLSIQFTLLQEQTGIIEISIVKVKKKKKKTYVKLNTCVFDVWKVLYNNYIQKSHLPFNFSNVL